MRIQYTAFAIVTLLATGAMGNESEEPLQQICESAASLSKEFSALAESRAPFIERLRVLDVRTADLDRRLAFQMFQLIVRAYNSSSPSDADRLVPQITISPSPSRLSFKASQAS